MHHISAISFTFLLVVLLSSHSDAKRGCNAFGHACFGGHGKRSALDGSAETPFPIVKFLQESNKMDPTLNMRNYDNSVVDDSELRFTFYELLKAWLEDYKRMRQYNTQQEPSDYQLKNIDSHNV